MSRSLRYTNPEICEHLASQYVAGVLSPRVRARIEVLAQTVPELDQAIAKWSDSFSELHQHIEMPEVDTSNLETIWASIQNSTLAGSAKKVSIEESTGHKVKGWFEQLFAWQMATAAGVLTSLILATVIWTTPTNQAPVAIDNNSQQVVGPNYLANMLKADSLEQEIQFVISAYAKTEDQPSRLHIQWPKDSQESESSDKGSHKGLHLWAENKNTGELVYIGVQAEGDGSSIWSLTKPTWLAITNSRRLLMTKGKTTNPAAVVFSGRCLQLTPWKA